MASSSASPVNGLIRDTLIEGRTAEQKYEKDGYAVKWTFVNGQTITQLWNGTLSASGSAITVTNASYNGAVPANGTTSFGFTGTWNGTNAVPALTCTV